jgi:glycosyltransferase involved in cell wall biosynthesis
VSVVIPTHNPDLGRLHRTLLALRVQTLPAAEWETVIVDNASSSFPAFDYFSHCAPVNLTITREPELGLTAARRRGFAAARGPLVVLVDDDNVLAPDYLAQVVRLFAAHPRIGALGGKSEPEFETPPPIWAAEFFPLLALRDCGAAPLTAGLQRAPDGAYFNYPACAPIGAGMALRREAALAWADHPVTNSLSDRRGTSLTSGGDNDIVLTLLRAGWEVGYFPELVLTHLIPTSRTTPEYLARLNRGIQKSWMQVLSAHGANPWGPLAPLSARLRQFKAWFVFRPWCGPANRIRWQGACGHFEGRVVAAG